MIAVQTCIKPNLYQLSFSREGSVDQKEERVTMPLRNSNSQTSIESGNCFITRTALFHFDFRKGLNSHLMISYYSFPIYRRHIWPATCSLLYFCISSMNLDVFLFMYIYIDHRELSTFDWIETKIDDKIKLANWQIDTPSVPKYNNF